MNIGAIVADFDEMRAVASLIEETLYAIGAACTASAAATDDLRLAAGAALDPLHIGGLAIRLVASRDGPDGLRVAEVELTAVRDLLDLAVATYVEADSAAVDTESAIAHHPWIVSDLIAAITAVTHQSDRRIAGWLSDFYPDGEPQVTPAVVARDESPPHSITDLVGNLRARSEISARWSPASSVSVGGLPPGFDVGTIDVRRIDGPEGVAWIIDLAGTSRWDLPGSAAGIADAHDPADFGADLRMMAGRSTAYQRGVIDAVAGLPIRPGQPILLAGHSEGGMVAMASGNDLAARGFDVAAVLTAGSPIATMRRPPGADILALENTDDIVPRLDGAANPSEPGWATLSFADQLGSVGANHSFVAYLSAAADADASDSPQIQQWRQKAKPFLNGTRSQMWSFRIQRVADDGTAADPPSVSGSKPASDALDEGK